jgi:hypothetical protein
VYSAAPCNPEGVAPDTLFSLFGKGRRAPDAALQGRWASPGSASGFGCMNTISGSATSTLAQGSAPAWDKCGDTRRRCAVQTQSHAPSQMMRSLFVTHAITPELFGFDIVGSGRSHAQLVFRSKPVESISYQQTRDPDPKHNTPLFQPSKPPR